MELIKTSFSGNIIRVIGVGGAGLRSVNKMCEQGIHGVDYAVCHSDPCRFHDISVPTKVLLEPFSPLLYPDIDFSETAKKLFDDGEKMVFIVAEMSGYIGSFVSPLLAKSAKDKGILTIGVVTIPFLFESKSTRGKALDSIGEMYKYVDALIVVNNESMKELDPDYRLEDSFVMTDKVLYMIVKSVAEIITVKGIINRDFKDMVFTLKDSGVTLFSYGFGSGENRLNDAVEEAFNSPLLNNNDIFNAKNVLFHISNNRNAHLKIDELTKVIEGFIESFDYRVKMLWGFGVDESLGDNNDLKFTVIASGFGLDAIPKIQGML